MFGTYRHAVDPKGRLFVPAKLREELGDVFYVTIGLDSCLSVYPTTKWAQIEQHYNELSLSQATRIRGFFANACKCEPDKQGRFLLPTNLREYADLKEEVTFIGQGNHAEIWNPEAFAKLDEEFRKPENLKAAMEELCF